MAALVQAWIIWGAMVAACVIYIVVGVMLHDPTKEPTIPNLRWIFLVVSAATVLVAQLVMTPMLLRQLKRTDPKARPMQAAHMVIVRSSFYEAIAIYGLILIILNQRLIDGIIFSGLAIALLMSTRPQVEHFDPRGSID